MKRPNVAPYDGAGVFTKVGLSRRAPALAVADVTFSKLQSTRFFESKLTFLRVPVERGDQPRHHARFSARQVARLMFVITH